MVKLRVTARVIPEDVYLASLESSAPPNSRIREEKRFYVVVREPESYYIGTLALEIKRKYESLYKKDLGQIKYLKANDDDCDLDPELYVVDVLVDEGKVLSDPSDQHVTIKVIQEQGRAIRQDSIVPDLSQTHYQLPERLARPAVPRFEDLAPQLGKRKAEENVQRNSSERKRSRLDEIERGGIATSIEHDPPTRSDVVIQNSQPERTGPSASSHQPQTVESPQFAWSFKDVGAPSLVERASSRSTAPQVRVAPKQVTPGMSDAEQKNTQSSSKRRGRHRTPVILREDLKTPLPDGVPADRPPPTSNSGSKKFLRPGRDTSVLPESDIDDSQMSPGLKDVSRITPRLIPRNATNSTRGDSRTRAHRELSSANSEQNPQSGDEFQAVEPVQLQDEVMEDENTRVSSQSDAEDETDRQKDSGGRLPAGSDDNEEQNQSELQEKNERPEDHPRLDSNVSVDDTKKDNEDDVLTANSTSAESKEPSKPRSPSRTSVEANETHPDSRALIAELRDQPNGDGDSHPTSSKMPKTQKTGRLKSKISGVRLTTDNDNHVVAASVDGRGRPDKMIVDTTNTQGASSDPKTLSVSALSTPGLDSPGLQLSRGLRDSTDREANDKSSRSKKSDLSILENAADASPSIKKTRSKKRTKSVTNREGEPFELDLSKGNRTETQNSAPEKGSLNPKSTTAKVNAVPQPAVSTTVGQPVEGSESAITQANLLAVPTSVQVQREPSADSQTTSSSKVVLPKGWSLERYENFVRSNAHLKAIGTQQAAKRRSTPLLAKTTSAGSNTTTSTNAELTTGDKEAMPNDQGDLRTTRAAKSVPQRKAAAKAPKQTNGKAATNKDSSIQPSFEPEQPVAKQPARRTAKMSTRPKDTLTKELSSSEASDTSEANNDEGLPSPPVTATKPTNVPNLSGSRATSKRIDPSKQSKVAAAAAVPSLSSNSTPQKTAQTSKQGPANTATKKSMPPPPPSSSISTTTGTGTGTGTGTTRKQSSTPTPAPGSTDPSRTTRFTTINTPIVRKNATGEPAPPSSSSSSSTRTRTLYGPPAFASARSLQELRAIANSANTSTRASPSAVSSSQKKPSRFARNSLLTKRKNSSPSDSDSDDESSDSDSSSNNKDLPPVSSKKTKKPTPMKSSQPDPSIRDDDDEEDSDGTSGTN